MLTFIRKLIYILNSVVIKILGEIWQNSDWWKKPTNSQFLSTGLSTGSVATALKGITATIEFSLNSKASLPYTCVILGTPRPERSLIWSWRNMSERRLFTGTDSPRKNPFIVWAGAIVPRDNISMRSANTLIIGAFPLTQWALKKHGRELNPPVFV